MGSPPPPGLISNNRLFIRQVILLNLLLEMKQQEIEKKINFAF